MQLEKSFGSSVVATKVGQNLAGFGQRGSREGLLELWRIPALFSLRLAEAGFNPVANLDSFDGRIGGRGFIKQNADDGCCVHRVGSAFTLTFKVVLVLA